MNRTRDIWLAGLHGAVASLLTSAIIALYLYFALIEPCQRANNVEQCVLVAVPAPAEGQTK